MTLSRQYRMRVALQLSVGVILSAGLMGCNAALPSDTSSAQASADRTTLGAATGSAKAIILFVGDGMGVSTVTAGRIYAGQKLGLAGEEHSLSFEEFPNVALIKTYNTDRQVPDSAGTMSAIVTGKKTRAGVLSIGPQADRGDCDAAQAHRETTFLEMAEARGWKTGVVSTATLTHATPAATYAHSPDRDWEADSDMPEAARASGCQDIAAQLVQFAQRAKADGVDSDGVDVAMGGGRAMFFPASTTDSEYADKTGARGDGRDLVAEWLAGGEGRQYVSNTQQLAAVNDPSVQVLGLFEPSHMQFDADRNTAATGEPSLAELTEFAIKQLQAQATDGAYFLMVEAGRIDHAHHFNNAYRALEDTVALDAAVRRAQELTGDDTLIIVTADHSHTFTIAGYPVRGNPMLGLALDEGDKPLLDTNGHPYTTLGYANGPARVKSDQPLTAADVADPNYQQAGLVPLRAETHGGEDVAAYATGPGASAVRGVMEQNKLFDVMVSAAWGTQDD